MTYPQLTQEFDPDLWKSGVEDGAFAGDRDPDSVWYTLKVDKSKVALASAVPGPGDLTTISYYVHPDHREKGYGTKIASKVTDLHERATFTIFRDNEASLKVAMAALRNKFSTTMGHNVVRLTKEAIDPTLLGAIAVGSLLAAPFGARLGRRIREALKRRKLEVPKDAVHLMDPEDIIPVKESDAREILKQALTERKIQAAILARTLASPVGGMRARGKVSRGSQRRVVETAATQVRKASPAELVKGSPERERLKKQVRGVQKLFPKSENVPHRQSVARQLDREIRSRSPQEQLF